MRERRAEPEADGLDAADDGRTDAKADRLGRADAVLRLRAGAHAHGRHRARRRPRAHVDAIAATPPTRYAIAATHAIDKNAGQLSRRDGGP